ncbi:MAG TPA: ethanolamine utilization protein EutN [Thermoanaerobacter sp.]|nr:MAG: Ethanolamine utilization protein EutN/carboxysome structural protein Ccml [Thermoanaerobacter thermocopriae]HAA63754.1 ethanolamine utilization protein EutN [Thermoanaerobacter sp.]
MQLAKVVGNVVATKKNDFLIGTKLLIVQPMKFINKADEKEESKNGELLVAVDTVGAGIGETVLIVRGSTATRVAANESVPIDAAIVGIVDNIEIEEVSLK